MTKVEFEKKNDVILNKGDKMYYARILPGVGMYEVEDMKIRMLTEDWFSCTENKEKHAYLFSYRDINKIVFFNRADAVDKVNEAEKSAIKISDETLYEEY